jgi:predicted DNA-binding transcriptional regulator YafY
MLAKDPSDELRLVVYDPKQKGFYVRQRQYDLNDIRLLAECVYSAKFVSEGQAKRLVNALCGMVSEHQAERIKHDAFLTDRVKTNTRSVLNSIDTINQAMSRRLNGQPHKPEKVKFKYMTYSIKDMHQQVERRHGGDYIVSPFALVINDGNYYLLAYDDYAQDMRTYRVDRMKGVCLTGEPREGKEAFAAIDLKTYTKRVFSMFGGQQERVTIRFINPLLDAVVDRFGNDKSSVQYAKVDDSHFSVTTQVEISDQFFGWVLGFGKKAKILEPVSVVDKFAAYLDKVREMY